ncbi:hypothetical protein KC340_g12448 [Hortaea werneckii]|nr:hypothetical protein KC342_g12745 [Hortaea werneckii]KAI7075216.1 hypothetical protein KC339_g13990 [Hortaea werneckii]KAI7225283.1 hypothetical protein KC365_g10078 [Hortaea werneckii]KAI7303574.1 hypothetical protein KC340_g12448 [Hortaea werneckii]KAI7383875.1 hypothetical protein KC328_g11069 [Hortaea werneckii]
MQSAAMATGSEGVGKLQKEVHEMEKARIPQLKAIEKLEKECLNAERDLASAKGYLNFIDQDSTTLAVNVVRLTSQLCKLRACNAPSDKIQALKTGLEGWVKDTKDLIEKFDAIDDPTPQVPEIRKKVQPLATRGTDMTNDHLSEEKIQKSITDAEIASQFFEALTPALKLCDELKPLRSIEVAQQSGQDQSTMSGPAVSQQVPRDQPSGPGEVIQLAMPPQQDHTQAHQGPNASHLHQYPQTSMSSPIQRSSPSQQSTNSQGSSTHYGGKMSGDQYNYIGDGAQ